MTSLIQWPDNPDEAYALQCKIFGTHMSRAQFDAQRKIDAEEAVERQRRRDAGQWVDEWW